MTKSPAFCQTCRHYIPSMAKTSTPGTVVSGTSPRRQPATKADIAKAKQAATRDAIKIAEEYNKLLKDDKDIFIVYGQSGVTVGVN